jgi:nitrogen regulation protein NR(I)
MYDLLVIDDEPNVLYSLERGLRSQTLGVRTARSGEQGLRQVRECRPDAVILDVRLPDGSGLDVFSQIRAVESRLPVIIITAFAATETAIEAMKRGAFEYLLKPVDLHQLREQITRALELRRMSRVPALLHGEEGDPAADQIVGQSPAMQEVYKAIGRVAGQPVNVLLVGESGTGKELVARAIYQHSGRADRPFLAINCAAIPEGLLESELFGHERGAFTGADRRRVGKFEQADGGTLFLDEIGDMALSVQAKVLRLIQEQRFERVGGAETIATDVRVIAATNQDLPARVESGQFRRDLLYRLNGYTINLPPLRERREDVRLLAEHYARLASKALGKAVQAVTPEALELLERHDWPGNVRELQNVVRFAVIHSTGEALTPACLPAAFRGEAAAASGDALDVVALTRELLTRGKADIYRAVMQEVDRVVLAEALRHTGGNQVQASELLGISRTTLRAKLPKAPGGGGNG